MPFDLYAFLGVENFWELVNNLMMAGAAVVAALILYRVGLMIIQKVTKIEKSPYVSPQASKVLCFGLRTLLKYGLIFLVLLVVLEIFQVRVITGAEIRAVAGIILKTIGIVVLAKIAINILQQVIDQIFSEKLSIDDEVFKERRKQTLNGLLKNVVMYVVYFLAGIMILENFGIQTTSILAGVGVLGLAVSFGAQNLIRDIITGFFIMLEDQYSVDDWVTISGVFGKVEELGLRTTKVRQWTGEFHTIPNGQIAQVVNYSRGNMLGLITVSIAYEEDINQAIAVMEDVGKKAVEELSVIVEEPTIQGVTELADSGVEIRAFCRTLPNYQWMMERELRKRYKLALDEAGIEIPYPRRVVIQQNRAAETEDSEE